MVNEIIDKKDAAKASVCDKKNTDAKNAVSGDSVKEQTDSVKPQADSVKEQGDSAKEQADSAKEQVASAKEQPAPAKEQVDSAKEQTDSAKEQTDSAKKEDTGALAQYILKRINCAQPKVTPLKSLDLTQSQGALLKRLFSARESGIELKMSEFSAMLGSTKSATSQAVAKLERMGLVKRKWSKEDRRRVLVGLTAKGAHVAEEFNKGVLQFIRGLLDKMDEDEIRIFLKMFEKCMD